MSKTLENLRTGKYEVVDNQGVSVTQHFIECLEKEFTDLEAKLAESEKDKLFYFFENGEKGLKIRELKQQLAESEKTKRNQV